MNRLDGKIALVTGAARGIGAAVAERMNAEGATVIGTDIASSGNVSALDVTKEADWLESAARIRDEFGRLDILVNNAGSKVFIRSKIFHWRIGGSSWPSMSRGRSSDARRCFHCWRQVENQERTRRSSIFRRCCRE